MTELTSAQRRILAALARHADGQPLTAEALSAITYGHAGAAAVASKVAQSLEIAGLAERLDFAHGWSWRITAEGMEAHTP